MKLGIKPLSKQWWPQFLNFYNIFISWWNSVIPGTLIKTGNRQQQSIDIIAIASADANGVLNEILEALEGLDLSQDEIKSKLIGCTFHGASVNQGAKGGVIAKLKNLIPHVLVSLWCAPHKLELSLLDTAKEKDHGVIITTVEKAVDPIYRFYYASPKRHRELNDIAEIIDEDPVYFAAPSGTRWMASHLRAYKALLRHYPAVIMHLEEASHRRTEEGSRCVAYQKLLKSRKFIDGISFLSDVLCVLAEVSLSFQKEDLLVTDVVIKLTEASLKLTQMKTLKGKIFSEVQGRISGPQYEKSGKSFVLTGTPYDESVLNAFLESTNQHITKRFEHMRQTPFHEFEIFDCRNHPHADVSLAAYRWDELGVLISFLSSVLTEEEQTAIPHEWPAFTASVKARKRTKTAHEILSDMLGSNPEDICNLLILVRIMVTLSPSSASVERGFSQMKALKSVRRSRMHNSTLSALMRINHMRQSLHEFDPLPAVRKWLTARKRNRRVKTQAAKLAVRTEIQQATATATEASGPDLAVAPLNTEATTPQPPDVPLLPDMPADAATTTNYDSDSSDEDFLGFDVM